MTSIQDRLRGMLLGVCLGDSLGLPAEKSKAIFNGKLEEVMRFNRFQGKRVYPPGTLSDDSLMTLSLAEAITEQGEYNTTSVIEKYLLFANKCPFLGKNTRELFKGVKTVNGYHHRFSNKFSSEEIKLSTQGNGCLMRCSPLVIFSSDTQLTDCYLTNPNETSYLCVKEYCEMMKSILTTGKTEINPSPPELIKNCFDTNVRDLHINKGWVCTALWCVMWCFRNYSTEEDFFTKSMDYLIRGKNYTDTDTNAAIVGGMIGCLRGYERLILEQEENVKILFKTNEFLEEKLRLSSEKLSEIYTDI